MKNHLPLILILLVISLHVFTFSKVGYGQNADLVVHTGHSNGVKSVAFSPNGKMLASGSTDNTVRLWNVETGQFIKSFASHTAWVTSVAFSPDGRTLASGSYDNTIKLWNVATGQQIKTLKGHTDEIWSVVFSPDGKVLATGGKDSTIRIWNVETWQLIKPLNIERTAADKDVRVFEIRSLSFAPDGKALACRRASTTIELWNVETEQFTKITAYGGSYLDNGSYGEIEFSPDGKMLAITDSSSVAIWDGRKIVRVLRGTVDSVVFSSDGKTIAVGGDETIKLWNVKSGALIKPFDGHTDSVQSVAFSPDGKLLASGSNDRTIRLWNVKTGKVIKSLSGQVDGITSVAISSDGKNLAGATGNTIKLWNTGAGQFIKSLEKHTGSVTSIAFSPDGSILVSGSWDNTIKFWDVKSAELIKSLEVQPGANSVVAVKSVAFSPNGKLLASGSQSTRNVDTIKLWNVETRQFIKSFANQSGCTSVAFSPDGQVLVSRTLDGNVKLWNVESGQVINKLEYKDGWLEPVAYSPDGKMLASSRWGVIYLWTAEGLKQLEDISSLKGYPHYIQSLTFSPQGKMLASSTSFDNTIKLWNVENSQLIKSLEGHTNSISSVAFSSDGKFLLSGSNDATMKLWDTIQNKLLATLILLGDDSWVVTTPEGQFDTDKSLDRIEGLHWVLNDEILKPLPLEIFMRDYYEPQLLARLLKCTSDKDHPCAKEFKPVRDITKLNRVQPPVKISHVSRPDGDGYVNVTVEVGKGVGEYLVNGKESSQTTDVYDLRLFRDGQMVGSWPNDGAEKLLQSTSQGLEANEKLIGETRLLRELRDWQQATKVQPNNTVKVDPKTGMLTLPPFRVKLPRGKDVSEIEFSAYAFNDDRVKSQTARWQWPANLKAKLPKAQPVKARAYIVTIGVNAYENPEWNLKYAANDAHQIQKTLIKKLNQGGEYQEVVSVSLISDYQTIAGKDEVTEKSATKANIKEVLDRLAGKPVNSESLKNISNAEKLRKAEPDDLIIISFSSHGYADSQGNFYLIPYDVGPGSTREINSDLLRHAISSEELSLWLRDVDAGEMVMVVDACHAAASVKGEGFKPGPMGSRGLGQLSYDKGMRILTSTQSDDVAVETDFTQQGLLSYVLTHDGIQSGLADFKPKDQTITLAEWLEYAVDRVPTLYGEIKEKYQLLALNEIKSLNVGQGGRTKLLIFSRDGSNSSMKKGANQQPSLFDFTRKKRAVVLAKMN